MVRQGKVMRGIRTDIPLDPTGLERLMRMMLATAYMDGTVLTRQFANSIECEKLCLALGIDYRTYRYDLARKARLRAPRMKRLKTEQWQPDLSGSEATFPAA